MQKISFVLIIILGIVSSAHGAAQNYLEKDRVLYFAVGWRESDPSQQNVLQLGVVFQCGDALCMEYEEFPGGDNLLRQPLPEKHGMIAPYGNRLCANQYLTTIRGFIHSNVSVHTVDNDTGLVLQTGLYKYIWERDTTSAGGFVLTKLDSTGIDLMFGQPIGFAYVSEDLTGSQIRSSDLIAYFDGQNAHKDMLMGAMDDWSQKQTSLDLRKFRSSSVAPILEFDQPGLPDVVRKYNKPMMWAHHSVMILPRISGRLNYVLHEYGHDFNANGCFDEFGHNKLMLPVFDRGVITAFVYIEYSPDMRDGVPMISVGRYFRKR